jgi:hypothetical protein
MFLDDKAAPTTTPTPIPEKRYEEISRKMLAVQSAELELQQAQLRLVAAREEAQKEEKIWVDYENTLIKEYGAGPGCHVNKDKTWNCPTVPPAVTKP